MIEYVFILFYSLLMIFIQLGLNRKLKLKSTSSAAQTFTLIVAARNEEDSIAHCINSIKKLSYDPSMFEVIIINDRSTDRTEQIIDELIRNENHFRKITISDNEKTEAPKKHAINKAISLSRNDIVITIDADSVVPESLLLSYSTYYASGYDVVAGPVAFYPSQSLSKGLMAVDFFALITFSAGFIRNNWPVLCSGANFSYKRQSFIDVNGFEGIDHVSSGDDDLLLHKFNQAKFSITYAWSYEACVLTKAPESIGKFIRQRIRWGSKGAFYTQLKDRFLMYYIYMLMVFFVSISILMINNVESLIKLFLIKIAIDSLSSLQTLIQYKRWKLIFLTPIYAIIHPIYVTVFGVLSLFMKPTWK